MTPVTHKALTSIIRHAARYGRVNVAEVNSTQDMHTAKRFSAYFHAAVAGLEDESVMRAIKAVQADGVRTFRSGCGMWLTDKEFNEPSYADLREEDHNARNHGMSDE